MKDIVWNNDNTISVDVGATKKCTGTRFGAILGKNKWSTPFETWCAITRTYEEPFTDTIYTTAGKTIEPRQAQYMADKYFFKNLITPTDVYGENYFQNTRGDFFGENKIFGGMWDYLFVDKDENPECVLEMKTTKRVEDWADDIPEYYALQAALYAYLLDVDEVIMVCTVLKESDYNNIDKFEVTDANTFERRFKVSERYPNFDSLITYVLKWWREHVETGISPAYDVKKDKTILDELKKTSLNPDTDIAELLAEAEQLKAEIDEHNAKIDAQNKRLKVVTELLKEYATSNLPEDKDKIVMEGEKLVWTLAKSSSTKVDEKKLKADGLYEQYSKTTESYRFTNKERK